MQQLKCSLCFMLVKLLIAFHKTEMLFIIVVLNVYVFVFQSGSRLDRVFNTYKLMHTNQTVDFVKQKVRKSGTKTVCQVSPKPFFTEQLGGKHIKY